MFWRYRIVKIPAFQSKKRQLATLKINLVRMKLKWIFIYTLLVISFLANCSQQNKPLFLYVAQGGSDVNPGSIEAPFVSIQKAKESIKEYLQQNKIPKGGIIVNLQEGIYPVLQTLHFKADDGGDEKAPVIYRAFPGEEVRFVGGEVIDNFRPLSDLDAMERIDKTFHNKIWQADLTAKNIKDYGEFKPTGMSSPVQPSPMELFFNGEPMTLARFPNKGEWMLIASVPQSGDTLINEGIGPERRYRFGLPVGRHYGRFKYSEDKPANWLKNDNIWLHGYWSWDWADSYVKLDHIDVAKKEFIPAKPHSHYGYTQNQRYYAFNILEELDSPGEWYLDRQKGTLYFWPPTPVEQGIAVVSVVEDLMVHIENSNYLHFEGIIFESSRGEAIKIEGGSHNLIAGCIIRNIGANGIIIDGGFHNGVSGCDIYNIGDRGLIIMGGDRKTLEGVDNFAVNNHIFNYSRINRTLRPAISIHGVGNRLAHNYIHDAPHVGVYIAGNNHILEYNEVHDIAIETGDVGAFYIGRDWTERGNIIRYNYFHHLLGPGRAGVSAVYLDDAASGTTVFGNVFYKAKRGVLVGGGHDNIIENNIFVEGEPAIHLDARGVTWAKDYIIKGGSWQMYEKLETVKFNQPPYSTSYPSLAGILERGDPSMQSGNVFKTNISYGGTWKNIAKGVEEYTMENNHILEEVPSHIDAENGKLYPENEQILKDMGFRKIAFDSIGLYIDEYRHSLPGK